MSGAASGLSAPFLQKLFSLDGKVVLVTGGGSGIGRKAVQYFYSAGAHVVVADINGQAAAETLKSLGDGPGSASEVVLDVTDLEAVKAAVEAIVVERGRLDVVFASAGIVKPDTVASFDAVLLEKMMAVNFYGVVNAAIAALPQMFRQQHGKIIAMGSVSGELAVMERISYTASKHAVHGFIRGMGTLLGRHGITLCGIAPARVYTEMVQGYLTASAEPAAMLRKVCSTQSSGAMLMPEDVAALALFLASPAARGFAGEILTITDGWRAGYQTLPGAEDSQAFLDFRGLVERETGLSLT